MCNLIRWLFHSSICPRLQRGGFNHSVETTPAPTEILLDQCDVHSKLSRPSVCHMSYIVSSGSKAAVETLLVHQLILRDQMFPIPKGTMVNQPLVDIEKRGSERDFGSTVSFHRSDLLTFCFRLYPYGILGNDVKTCYVLNGSGEEELVSKCPQR